MLSLALDTVVLLAALGWAGGLFTVGAVVAPTVFRSGLAQAGDVMTAVFLRFDRVAVALALVVLVLEAAGFFVHRVTARQRAARAFGALVLAGSVALQAGYFSPRIAQLHREGVRRGVGAAGARFDAIHRASSLNGRLGVAGAATLAFAVVLGRKRDDALDEGDDADRDDAR